MSDMSINILSYMFENKSTLSKKGKKSKKESIFSSIAAKGLMRMLQVYLV